METKKQEEIREILLREFTRHMYPDCKEVDDCDCSTRDWSELKSECFCTECYTG